MSNKKILILPGDGIGQEVMVEQLKISECMEQPKSLQNSVLDQNLPIL